MCTYNTHSREVDIHGRYPSNPRVLCTMTSNLDWINGGCFRLPTETTNITTQMKQLNNKLLIIVIGERARHLQG